MSTVQNKIKNKYLWFSVDETIDVNGRYVDNFIIGALNQNRQAERYLIGVKAENVVKRCNFFGRTL